MKRILVIAFILVSFLMAIEYWYYYDQGGNLVIYVQNQSEISKQGVDIKVDYEKSSLFNLVFSGEETTPLESKVLKGLGKKEIYVRSATLGVQLRKKIMVLPVTWIVINVYEDQIHIEKSCIPIILQ